MKKRVWLPLVFLIVISVGLYAWFNRINYDIHEKISSTEINPKDGIHFSIEADKKNGTLHIENDSERYIVIEFGRKPIHIEIQQEDGRHRLYPTKS